MIWHTVDDAGDLDLHYYIKVIHSGTLNKIILVYLSLQKYQHANMYYTHVIYTLFHSMHFYIVELGCTGVNFFSYFCSKK